MAVRIRKSVYSLAPEAPELVWYRKAVGALRKLPRDRIGSWEFIAACHGIPRNVTRPTAAAGLWNECQHQTWFFLSWHRAYLAGFEAIVAEQVAKLGGPSDWALPYWNYSAGGASRQLPPAFRARRLSDGTSNDLWSPRNLPTPPQTVLTLPVADVSLSRLQLRRFSTPPGSMAVTFGGHQTAANHLGGTSGGIEELPHNVIHDDIGGLMGDPLTAALDPIFWLHHCNIDRLWEVWRGSTATPRDPVEPQWLSGVKFKLVKAGGQTFDFTSQQALNTQTLLHGYRFDNVPPVVPAALVAAAQPQGVRVASAAGQIDALVEAMTAQTRSRLVAAADGVKLGAAPVQAVVRADPARASIQARDLGAPSAPPTHHFLRLQNIAAAGPARNYKVFVDRPDDNRVPIQVGTLSTFGIEGASDPDGPHGGNGMTQVFDITGAIEDLGLTKPDFAQLRVTFEPIEKRAIEDVPDDFVYADRLRAAPSELTVGAIQILSE